MNNKYWEEEIETMPQEDLRHLQLNRLKKTIRLAANAPYYKKVFEEYGITPDTIQTIDDIQKLPFTTKADMRANYPFGLVAGNLKEDGVRIHSSSGTTGTPTVIVHSQHDLDSWANLVARCLYMVGIRKTDVFQNSSGYGMFTGGLGFQYGAERLGALTVPAAAGNSKQVPNGEIGELVLTTLDREMMPLIRYRTRDLTRILPGTCPCGRTHLCIDRIKGRSDDMFIIKGVNIFPMQVEKILLQFPSLGSNYLITLDTINNQDEMIVEVELSDLSTDNYIELEKIRKEITRQLKDEILVTPKVKLVKKGSLPQSEGKAIRVKDLRNNQ